MPEYYKTNKGYYYKKTQKGGSSRISVKDYEKAVLKQNGGEQVIITSITDFAGTNARRIMLNTRINPKNINNWIDAINEFFIKDNNFLKKYCNVSTLIYPNDNTNVGRDILKNIWNNGKSNNNSESNNNIKSNNGKLPVVRIRLKDEFLNETKVQQSNPNRMELKSGKRMKVPSFKKVPTIPNDNDSMAFINDREILLSKLRTHDLYFFLSRNNDNTYTFKYTYIKRSSNNMNMNGGSKKNIYIKNNKYGNK